MSDDGKIGDSDRKSVQAILDTQLPGWEVVEQRSVPRPTKYDAESPPVEELREYYRARRRSGASNNAGSQDSSSNRQINTFLVKPKSAGDDFTPRTIVISLSDGVILGIEA